MKTTYTFLKKNKALLILPLALLPFVVLIFYILGGGKNAGQESGKENLKLGKTTGANYELPEADKSIEIFDKMEAYRQGKSQVTSTHDYNIMGNDSLKNMDVNISSPGDSAGMSNDLQIEGVNANVSNNLLSHIKNKEAQVRKEMEENNQKDEKEKGSGSKPVAKPKKVGMESLQKTGIKQLDQVFDENISLNRQNDSLQFYLKEAHRKLKELEARKPASFNLVKNRSQTFDGKTSVNSLIKAEIYETTTVLDGNRVKIRLLEDCMVGDKTIPQNTFIYGICQIKNERLHIYMTQIPTWDNFLPVELSIHDLDGLEGLYVPDNAARKVAKEVGNSTNTSSIFGVTIDPLTYAGVRAADKTAQSLFKMVRLKKVTVKKNTLVYLINQK